MDQIKNPRLAPLFVWDAQRIYKYNGESWVRFYDEPWTADRMWEFQVYILSMFKYILLTSYKTLLPEGGKPLCFIIYADKTKLSSFGTEMGYPVMARIANLPVDIRNGEGTGGACVVGWLPIVRFN